MNILVLDVPGLHVGYLGAYGNDWVGTPNIDRLAAEGVVFDRHYYDVEQPEPFAWTGHRPLPVPLKRSLPPVATFGAILDAHGAGHVFLQAEPGVSAGNLKKIVAQAVAARDSRVTWVRFPSLAPPWNLPDDLLNSYCEGKDEPWPNPPEGFLEDADELPRLQETYAAVVTYVDAQLGGVWDALRRQHRLDDRLVCLTAAHGLPLGEHGTVGFTHPWLHEEFVHLPLVLRLPRGEAAGLRLDALTQPVDLFPTLLEALDLRPPPSHGHSLWPLIRAGAAQVRPYALSGRRVGDRTEWALRSAAWALLLPVDEERAPRLFLKPDDRWEVNDVRHHHMETAEELEKALREAAVHSRNEE
jgi:arylsulfatase A-like enzyme